MIGADGVHSLVRDIIVGPDEPIHKGRIAYRAMFPSALLNGFDIGPLAHQVVGTRPSHRHLLHHAERSELYFVTSVPEPAEWVTRESWSAKGDVKELRKAYEGFHPDVRAVLEACPDCHKWAILEREPLPRWSDGRVVAAGRRLPSDDALHGAGRRDRDRGRSDPGALPRRSRRRDIEGAFQRYEAHRKPRTSRIQAISSANTWMKGGNDDTSWLYGYDAWNVPLDRTEKSKSSRLNGVGP